MAPALAGPTVDAALATLEQALESDRLKAAIPGMAIAITLPDRLLWAHGFGQADLATKRPVDPHTRFGIGSISKLLTAMAIMILRDDGKLDLDAPVTRSVPGFRLQGDDHPEITNRELLLQLSGLPREPLGLSWDRRVAPSRDQLLADLASEPEALPRESRWKYSNLGYAVLGLVIEGAAGRAYADYLPDAVFRPLGMADALIDPDPTLPNLASGYGGRGANGQRVLKPFYPKGGVAPAAGIHASVLDLAGLLRWMLAGGPPLGDATRREMLRIQASTGDPRFGQGLGFETRQVGEATRIGHAGLASGFAGRLDIDPALGLGVVVLTNADENGPTRLVDLAFALLGPAVAAEAPPPPARQADPAWNKYLGTYRYEERRQEIVIIDGRLAWQDPGQAEPARTRVYLDPVGPDRFRFASGGLVGEILTFDTDNTGRVVSMHAAGHIDYRERAGP